MPEKKPVSVIVPTFREAQNIPVLTERIFQALADTPAELVIVDDNSADGTEQVVEGLAQKYPVRLIVRRDERGLSSAVLAGFRAAKHDRLAVLDADLQHPPEALPQMLAHLDDPECDFVMATRYAGHGALAKNWPIMRKLASRFATALARPLAPLSDPMSGFFALRRATWERAKKVNPIGYKIALELYVKCGCGNPREVPIQFGTRAFGKSKADLGVGLKFLQHLLRLYLYRFPALMLALSGAVMAVLVWVIYRMVRG